jgi:hypothetical protein
MNNPRNIVVDDGVTLWESTCSPFCSPVVFSCLCQIHVSFFSPARLNRSGASQRFSFNWAPHHEGVWGKWRCSSTHSLASALDGGEWSASLPGCFITRERAPGTQWIGDRWAPEPFWTRWWRENSQPPPGIEPYNPDRPGRPEKNTWNWKEV